MHKIVVLLIEFEEVTRDSYDSSEYGSSSHEACGVIAAAATLALCAGIDLAGVPGRVRTWAETHQSRVRGAAELAVTCLRRIGDSGSIRDMLPAGIGELIDARIGSRER